MRDLADSSSPLYTEDESLRCKSSVQVAGHIIWYASAGSGSVTGLHLWREFWIPLSASAGTFSWVSLTNGSGSSLLLEADLNHPVSRGCSPLCWIVLDSWFSCLSL